MTNLTYVGRTLGLTSLTLGAAAGLVSVGALAAFRRSLPRLDGTVQIPGLQAQTEVLRDRWGVPYIYASNNHDLFMALGYVHAQDRLWQMELNRATGHGHLSQIFGAEALDSDRFTRIIGLSRLARRDAEQLDDESRAVIEAYIAGINVFLETHENRLPLEFVLLRHHPRPWDVSDVIVWSKTTGYGLSFNWVYEVMNARLAAALGPERARELHLDYPPDHPVVVPENALQRHGIGPEAPYRGNRPTDAEGQGRNGAGRISPSNGSGRHNPLFGNPGEGSNGWVVRGLRSHSGSPLLANDPHLRSSLPVLWYQAYLEGGDYKMAGATFPGLPAVLSGHNQHIAWGVTNGMVDVQDLYIERFDPNDPLRYEWCGAWEQVDVVQEEIFVKGQSEPHIEEVRITRHGPIVSSMLAAPDENEQQKTPAAAPEPPRSSAEPVELLALRWSGYECRGNTTRSALAMNRAANWEQFRTALAEWDMPVQNFIYADVEGHYGYLLAGQIPVRQSDRHDGELPVPGWTGTHEWQGFIPANELPAALDPPDGLVVTANNQITDASHPYHDHLRGLWMNGYRTQRIRDLLDTTPRHDIQSFARIQTDLYSLPGAELASLITDLACEDPLEVQARDILGDWNGMLEADSVAGTVYVRLRYHLERLAYADMGDVRYAPVGRGLFQVLPGSESVTRRSIPVILARIAAAEGPERADAWLGTSADGQPRTWNALLREAFQQAVAELSDEYGNDPKHWKYGRTHSLTLRHILGRVPVLSPLFNRGSWPTGGDIDTVCMGYVQRDSAAPNYVAPLYRQICDTGDWDASVWVLLGGQCGHPASRHYVDQTALWLRGEYHPMLWSRARIEEHTVAALTLEPWQQPN